MIGGDRPALTRLPDWRTRLIAYLETVARRPFVEGTHDCALFTAGAIEAMTGTDLAEGFRGRYDATARGLAMLRREGHGSAVDIVAARLPEIRPSFAAEGDVAVLPDPKGGDVLGIVQGALVYVAGPFGLALEPRLSMTRAFRL